MNLENNLLRRWQLSQANFRWTRFLWKKMRIECKSLDRIAMNLDLLLKDDCSETSILLRQVTQTSASIPMVINNRTEEKGLKMSLGKKPSIHFNVYTLCSGNMCMLKIEKLQNSALLILIMVCRHYTVLNLPRAGRRSRTPLQMPPSSLNEGS